MLDRRFTDFAMRRYEKDSDGLNVLSVVDQPNVTAEKIVELRRRGQRFKLYLEEIDKIAQTDARRNNLFGSSIRSMSRKAYWSSIPTSGRREFAVQFGEDFAWRIGKKCTVINLFEK